MGTVHLFTIHDYRIPKDWEEDILGKQENFRQQEDPAADDS
jgi:hypothetical protein